MTGGAAPIDIESRRRDGWIATFQILALAALAALMFRKEVSTMVRFGWRDMDAAHMLAAPVLIALMWRLRRGLLAERLERGSNIGVGLVVLSLLIYTFSSWPFNYGYPRWLSIVPAVAGGVLAVGGWRLFHAALPMLIIFTLSIPIGSRYYAFLIIRPETLTIELASEIWNMLPGVLVELNGPDFTFHYGDVTGSIALGEPHRGASLLASYLLVGVFTTFCRVRPWWQILVMAVASVPIVLICNFSRLMVWGVMSIYAGAPPGAHAPRILATVLSILLAWGLFAATLGILKQIVAVPETAADPKGAPP